VSLLHRIPDAPTCIRRLRGRLPAVEASAEGLSAGFVIMRHTQAWRLPPATQSLAERGLVRLTTCGQAYNAEFTDEGVAALRQSFQAQPRGFATLFARLCRDSGSTTCRFLPGVHRLGARRGVDVILYLRGRSPHRARVSRR